jgi:diguanylate cyclase (GGDEF)-like protein
MSAQAITVDEIERVLGSKTLWPRFPGALEVRYENDRAARRTRRMRGSLLETAVIYNCFLAADFLLARDMLAFSFTLHFFIITPVILIAVALQDARIRPSIRDGIIALGALGIGAQVLAVFWLTTSPLAHHYQYLIIVLLVFVNTSQRLPFRLAAPVSLVLGIGYVTATWNSGHLSAAEFWFAMLMTGCILYQALLSTYELERAIRRSYLMRLKTALVSQRHETEAQRDPLTGLSNRRHLDLTLERLFTPDRQRPVAAILLDLDHFKRFNDHYGHVAGDAALKRVAACLATAVRGTDELAIRYGGEELMLLLSDTDAAEARALAERLRQGIAALAISHDALGSGQIVTASFGVAVAPAGPMPAEALIAAADDALYAAKRAGRNCVWPSDASAEPSARLLPLMPRLIRQGTNG